MAEFDKAYYEKLMDGLEISEIKLSDLERTSRIDAEFYQKKNLLVNQVLDKWDKNAFSKCFNVSDGNHMSISYEFCNEGVPYYRGQDIYNLFIENSSPLYISNAAYNKSTMRRSYLKKGDVLMSIVGAIIGNSALVTSDREATCSCKLAILRSCDESIMPETMLIFIKTKYGQNQIQKFKRGAAQTGLLLEDFQQLFIPKFSKELQYICKQYVDKIKMLMDDAMLIYSEAEQLLIEALGLQNFNLQNEQYSIKSFKNSFGDMGRLDAEYYQKKYDDLFTILAKFHCKKLGKIVEVKKSIEPGSDCYSDIGIPFVRVSDITKYGITEPKIKLPYNLIDNMEDLFPKKGIILLTKDGSVGIAYKVEEDKPFITSGALLHLKVLDENEINPDYLTILLNSKVVQMQAERDAGGSIIRHWKPSEIADVVIPILDKDIQSEIADKAKKSFVLRKESQRILCQAVEFVEMAIEQGEKTILNNMNCEGDHVE